MKYKYIPKPILPKGQEAKPQYDLQNDVLVIGWEVGHYEDVKQESLPDDIEPQKEWVKDYEVMELTPEQEEEWEYAQGHPTPTAQDRIEAQVIYTALMTDTLIEGE